MPKLSANAWDWLVGVAWGAIGAAGLLAIVVLMAPPASARVPAGELTLAVTTGVSGGQVTPTLTWSTTPEAASCVATGGWTGSKAAAGTEAQAPITASREYALTCSWADAKATLTWSAPTRNTDGTPLTDLAAFIINYGTDLEASEHTLRIPNPAATTQVIEPLAAGVWYFRMRAESATGGQSARTARVSKTIQAVQQVRRVTAGVSKPQTFPVAVH